VKKGQKALTLCMPLTCKRTKTVKKDDGTGQEEEFSFTHFAYKAHCYHELVGTGRRQLKIQEINM
jgi:hypothetical protein